MGAEGEEKEGERSQEEGQGMWGGKAHRGVPVKLTVSFKVVVEAAHVTFRPVPPKGIATTTHMSSDMYSYMQRPRATARASMMNTRVHGGGVRVDGTSSTPGFPVKTRP